MSLIRSFETGEYYGYVTLGNGNVVIKSKFKYDDNVIFKGCIYDDINNNIKESIREVIYLAREKVTGSKYL